MSNIAISIRGISKAYSIGLQEEKTETMVSAILKSISAPVRNFRNVRRLSTRSGEDRKDLVYALKDISFDINHGEAVAIIGHNGAGKSTLLKIISKIADPTEGRINIYGRISSLLEVGTGFHPDLTGRENVYLNGTILGMRKHEIDRKFDEIVEFSGIHKYIDTPVKRYSSGMRVRLAFSVAAHLEAEILLVDEVLAVGDVEFQKKCLGKMNEVANAGRTVLFVSHNMGAIKELCSRGVVLEKGRKVFEGDINSSIVRYLEHMKGASAVELNETSVFSSGMLSINDMEDPSIEPGEKISIKLPFFADRLKNPKLILIVEDFMGQDIVNLSLDSQQLGMKELNGKQTLEIALPPLWLSPGIYAVHFKLLNMEMGKGKNKYVTEKTFFEVRGNEDIIKSGFHSGKKNTVLAPLAKWNFTPKSE